MKDVLPPCAGRWYLFDSIDVNDHREAAALCRACPMLDDCRKRLEDELSSQRADPQGTWAGQLLRPVHPSKLAPAGTPEIEDAMFTEAEARAAVAAYAAGHRTHRTILGTRVYNRMLQARAREQLLARATVMRDNGFTVAEAARELGMTEGALEKAFARARKAGVGVAA